MAGSARVDTIYRFGPFSLDPTRHLLTRAGVQVPLTPKAVDLLLILLERKNQTIPKEELVKLVWPDSIVEESNLAQTVFVLRKALGDSVHYAQYVLTVPGKGYRFVGRVDQECSGQPLGVQRNVVPSVKLLLITAVLVVLMLIGGTYLWVQRWSHYRHFTSNPPVQAPSTSVIVASLQNRRGGAENDWLSNTLAQMLSFDLSAGTGTRVVRLHRDPTLRTTAEPRPRPTVAWTGIEAAQFVVTGFYELLSNNTIRIHAEAKDVTSGKAVAEIDISGTESQLFDLVAQISSQLCKVLRLALISQQSLETLRRSIGKAEMMRLVADGCLQLRYMDPAGAKPLFEQAVSSDQFSPLAHLQLSRAWEALGYDHEAARGSERTQELAASAPAELQLWAAARYDATRGEWDLAREAYRQLLKSAPEDSDYVIELVNLEISSGAAGDAYSILAERRSFPLDIMDEAVLDLAEARAADAVSDGRRQEAAAELAIEKAERANAPRVAGWATLMQAAALFSLGNVSGALNRYERAAHIFSTLADESGVSQALLGIGNIYETRGQLSAAELSFRNAVTAARDFGSDKLLARGLLDLANVLYDRGQLDKAEGSYSEAEAVYGRMHDRRGRAGALLNIGNVLLAEGRFSKADLALLQALAIAREVGQQYDVAAILDTLAEVAFHRGQLQDARNYFQESLTIARRIGSKVAVGHDLAGLVGVFEAQDDSKGAGKSLKEMSRLDLNNVPFCLTAELYLNEGQTDAAEKLIRATLAQLATESHPDQSRCYAMLARVLGARGQTVGSLDACRLAIRAAEGEFLDVKLAGLECRARVAIANGNHRQAIQFLEQAVRQAKTAGDVPSTLTLMLELAKAELQASDSDSARLTVEAVARSAKSREFFRLARQAALLKTVAAANSQWR